MRGDRPVSPVCPCDALPAAPHARGSTRDAACAGARRDGCPACAGIDPRAAAPRAARLRLPRMRGDRPSAAAMRLWSSSAAPHARGSTRRLLVLVSPTVGCPACAGIDPRLITCSSCGSGLPRMRGDRPDAHGRRVRRAVAAPHARGSTRHGDYHARGSPGCPACAGIDPTMAASCAWCPWLPRMRGDRPESNCATRRAYSAAPHARGSTRNRASHGGLKGGCPACAGIDPRCRARSRLTLRLPRMRGDRPSGTSSIRIRSPAAPHARGSTHMVRRVGDLLHGCPACAGIDLQRRIVTSPQGGLPRMRGDRPSSRVAIAAASSAAPHARGSTLRDHQPERLLRGCPACAGIDPRRAALLTCSSGLPRMRGDRPQTTGLWRFPSGAAPHARGSTRPPPVRESGRSGCPACAGIDPNHRSRGGTARRLPRMRGDRPFNPGNITGHSPAAPHARGSTLGFTARALVSSGCPACAGIDPTTCGSTRSTAGLPRMRGDRPVYAGVKQELTAAAPHARGSTPVR